MRSILLAFLLIGCSAHRGLRIPGPTGSVGGETRSIDVAEAPSAAQSERVSRGSGQRIARAAASFVGQSRMVVHGERQRWDCSGMVCAAHKKADYPLVGNSRSLYERAQSNGIAHRRKRPSVGDVAFFDNTYDRNRNGKRDDPLSHVAIVESVDRDGTITLIHLGSKGIVRITMNLRRPHDREDAEGKSLNHVLRRGRDGGGVLTGELWRGFGSFWSHDGQPIAQR